MCPICKLTNKDAELIQPSHKEHIIELRYKHLKLMIRLSIISQDYDTLYELYRTIEHNFEEVSKDEESKEYNPGGFIIFTYSGMHYELVSYNEKKFFTNVSELPKKLIELIKKKCNKVGLYKKIKEFK